MAFPYQRFDVTGNVSTSAVYTTTPTLEDAYNASVNASSNGTDNSTAATSSALPHPLWLTIVLGTAASIVIVVTILGNILVLLSFFLERSIRQPTNYFIASLAMSDLLIGTFSMPCFTLYLLLGYWPLGEIICDLWLSLDWTVCLASQYTVFFITADRFCSVKIPAKYRNWRTDTKVRVMIALSWIIPSVVFFTSIIGWQYFVGGRTVPDKVCEVQFMTDPLFTFLLTIGYFWTTLIVMIILYVGIYRVALNLQKRANEKQKKMHNAMEMAKEKTKKSSGGAQKKASKKRVENNNARYLRGPNDGTITTSFSKNSDNENSKPSEEDRSSSPAFASDEDEGSSAEHKKESCYVNSAVQTEPTLKGMLGTSFNHMSRLAFSISGTSVSASQASDDKESTDGHQTPHNESDPDKPLLSDSSHKFAPIHETPSHNDFNKDITKQLDEPLSVPSLEKDILDGLKYIDEDSIKSLTSAENVKLLEEIKDMPALKQPNGAESPVWRKRYDDKTLLVPITTDFGSSEGLSNITETTKVQDSHYDLANDKSKSNHTKYKCEDSNAISKSGGLLFPNSSHHGSSKKKSKFRKPCGSPLQSLVNSLRPSSKEKKAPKSKSENRARKALRTISIILGAYVLCWTPYHIIVLIIGICRDYSCVNITFYYFFYWLCYLNSPINPFCYAFANAQFKRTFIRILKLDLHRT